MATIYTPSFQNQSINDNIGENMNTAGWLLKGGEAKTSVFHLGRYCSEWKASTYSYGEPSFHIVLSGECWLDLFNQKPRIKLEKGDILFFFNNFPFFLASSPDINLDDLIHRSTLWFHSTQNHRQPIAICLTSGHFCDQTKRRRQQ